MEKSYPKKEGHPPNPVNFSDRLGTGYYLSPGEGGAEDLGLKKLKFSRLSL